MSVPSVVLGLVALALAGQPHRVLAEPSFAEHLHQDAERDHDAPSARLATGALDGADYASARHPWPVKVLSIGHTIASYQNYGFGSRAPYFHHGLDIRADAGSTVIASAGGKVVNIENYVPGSPAYWEVAILDDAGFLWQYHHIERSSIPAAIHDAYKTGSKIASGTKIGEVFHWSITTFGERYHHVHLNVLGAGKAYQNPFAFLEPLADKDTPEIVDVGLLKNGKKVSGANVSAPYSVYAQVNDLILHKRFVVPPDFLYMEIDGGSPKVIWRFDRLPGGASNTDQVHKFYVPGLACGDYSCRKPVIDLGFEARTLAASSLRGPFPTTSGVHSVRVTARDFEGNSTSKDFTWKVE